MKAIVRVSPYTTVPTIPVSALHTLKQGMNTVFNINEEYLERHLVWEYVATREEGSSGRIMVTPLVHVFLSVELSKVLAERMRYPFMPPVISLPSGPRSMDWQIVLYTDAFVSVKELLFIEKNGLLQTFGRTDRFQKWIDNYIDLGEDDSFDVGQYSAEWAAPLPAPLSANLPEVAAHEVNRQGMTLRELTVNRLHQYTELGKPVGQAKNIPDVLVGRLSPSLTKQIIDEGLILKVDDDGCLTAVTDSNGTYLDGMTGLPAIISAVLSR
jgi:hypothetical protein